MKTKLPKRSIFIKERLDNITKEILASAKDKLAMIILFGSYARGNWVVDSYMEGHITYSYQSDLDIMLVTKSPKYAGFQGRSLQDKIEQRIERAGLGWKPFLAPPVTLITETIANVNKELEKNRYFYSDIKKEGVLLYDSGEFKLSEARDLPWKEVREIAQKDYDQWFKRGRSFLIDTYHCLERDDFSKAAFELHQATESFYNVILLVFSGYKPKLHDIRTLGSMAGNYNDELWSIFPYSEHDQKQAFDLLVKAYIDGRYSDDYKISKEELVYLIDRVEKLKMVTEKICLERIEK